MKIHSHLVSGLIAAVVSMAVPSVTLAASNIIFGPDGTEASTANSDGTWINMWGPSYVSTTFDPANPPPSGDTQGSVYNQGNWTGDTSGMDDYNMVSPGTWYGNVVFNGNNYSSIQMDFKYDTNSTMTPTSAAHLGVGFDTGYAFQQVTNLSFSPPLTGLADGNWHHLSIPIPLTMTGISDADGVSYYAWNPAGTSGTMNYWMANVELIANVVAVPPPTLFAPTKATPGLNVFDSTAGLYDRQEVTLVTNGGFTWVGNASAGNPVTYSFTIASFPTNVPAFSTEAYLFLVPNPAAQEGAPDWNETNVVVIEVQSTTNGGGQMSFGYKVNESYGQSMYTGSAPYTNAPGSWNGTTTNYLESGALTNVQSSNILGTWTIKFTSNTGGELIAPDNTTASFTFPAYNTNYFAETTGFNVYLGGQPNTATAINQPVVYSNFSISNTPNAFSDNFLADGSLNTNIWVTKYATGPGGVLVVPTNAPYWVSWTLPASGDALIDTSNLASGIWNNASTYAPFGQQGIEQQLISTNDLPGGNDVFFALVKRSFTQLLVLLPGQTNAPNTPTGVVGTPTPISGVGGGPQPVNVTVMAVDSKWNPVPGSYDGLTITSSDPQADKPTSPALSNGSTQFVLYFNNPGNQTITAADSSNTNILSNTSSPITVNP